MENGIGTIRFVECENWKWVELRGQPKRRDVNYLLASSIGLIALKVHIESLKENFVDYHQMQKYCRELYFTNN